MASQARIGTLSAARKVVAETAGGVDLRVFLFKTLLHYWRCRSARGLHGLENLGLLGYHRRRVLFLGGEYILTRLAEKLAQLCRFPC